MKNHVLRSVVLGALFVARRLPPTVLRALGEALGELTFHWGRPLRRDARATLRAAYPHAPEAELEALARKTFRALGALLGDTVSLFASPEGAAFAPEACELDALTGAVAEGRGVLFASAHLGPWERVAATLVARGVPLTAVGRESYDPALTRLYTELRSKLGVPCIFRGAPGSGVAMLRVLRRGGVLGVPMDLRSRVPSLTVPFLGRPALTPLGPARLALRTGAAVVVGTVAPGADGGLRLTATRLTTTDLSPDEGGERALLERLNDELSGRIRALPHLWPWPHRRFSTSGDDARARALD